MKKTKCEEKKSKIYGYIQIVMIPGPYKKAQERD